MDCSCTLAYTGDAESWDFASSTTQVARKQHKCSICYNQIQKGQRYTKVKGMCDNYFSTYKICPDCQSLIDTFFTNDYCYETLLDDLAEQLNGNIPPSTCMQALTPTARAMVCDIIERTWEEQEQRSKWFFQTINM